MFYTASSSVKVKWLKLTSLSFLFSIIFSSECFSQTKKTSKKLVKTSEENKYTFTGDSVFGKPIPLSEAKKIMDDYDKIKVRTTPTIVRALRGGLYRRDTSYYKRNIKAFIIHLDTLERYIKEIRERTDFSDTMKYLAVINASDNYKPTTIFALTKADSARQNFTIVASSTGKVPEHPGVNGRIAILKADKNKDKNKFEESDTLILETTSSFQTD